MIQAPMRWTSVGFEEPFHKERVDAARVSERSRPDVVLLFGSYVAEIFFEARIARMVFLRQQDHYLS